jgi:hypothetical protein
MDQQEKQALPDRHANTTALKAVAGNSSTATLSADQAVFPGGSQQLHVETKVETKTKSKVEFNIESTSFAGSGSGCSEIGCAIDLINNMASAVAKIHRAIRRRQWRLRGNVVRWRRRDR